MQLDFMQVSAKRVLAALCEYPVTLERETSKITAHQAKRAPRSAVGVLKGLV